jgi:hypothetical protein
VTYIASLRQERFLLFWSEVLLLYHPYRRFDFPKQLLTGGPDTQSAANPRQKHRQGTPKPANGQASNSFIRQYTTSRHTTKSTQNVAKFTRRVVRKLGEGLV